VVQFLTGKYFFCNVIIWNAPWAV